jgi:hypothetical protein
MSQPRALHRVLIVSLLLARRNYAIKRLPAAGRRRRHLSPASENVITQLEAVAQAGGLVEHPERPQVVNVTTYYLRNQDVVDVADELLAFQVNASSGTQDTVDKARLKDIPGA